MGTLYITQDDAFIGKTDERLTVRANKQTLQDIPLIKLDGVVILGRATVSPAAVIELLERKIPLSFLTRMGRYLGRLEPELTKNIFVRAAQWQAIAPSEQASHLVRSFVRGKLKNYRNALLRGQREYADLAFQNALTQLEQAIAPIDATDAIDSLRGLEGAGSAAYFGSFNRLIRVCRSSPPSTHRSGECFAQFGLLATASRHSERGESGRFRSLSRLSAHATLWSPFSGTGFNGGISSAGGGCSGAE
jgi:CRISP-associated protein Cas1